LDKYLQEAMTMTNWNKLLLMLDYTLGFFDDKATSKVTKRGQTYDNKTNEHVIYLEYRVRVRNGAPTQPREADTKVKEMSLLKQLLLALNRSKSGSS
jgi:hypothetical protein